MLRYYKLALSLNWNWTQRIYHFEIVNLFGKLFYYFRSFVLGNLGRLRWWIQLKFMGLLNLFAAAVAAVLFFVRRKILFYILKVIFRWNGWQVNNFLWRILIRFDLFFIFYFFKIPGFAINIQLFFDWIIVLILLNS